MGIVITLFLLIFSSCMTLPSLELERDRGNGSNISGIAGEGEMKVWVPYVGQGDATLIQFPDGKYLLIDAGPPPAAQDYLLPLFRSLGIDRLDALIISHYDLDHLGGVASLLAGEDGLMDTEDDIAVKIAYDRGGEPWGDSPGLGDYLKALETKAIPRRSLTAGERLYLDPAVRILCVAANGIVDDGSGKSFLVDLTPATFSGQENASSIGLLLEMGGFRYLTAGDLTGGGSLNGFLTPDMETPLAEVIGEVDVLHVDHHGSLSSSNENFVNGTRPKMVFIQAGVDNWYGHPSDRVLKRWKEIGAEVFSTQEGDSYGLTFSGSGININRFQ